ncbi:hypothetical protein BH11PLA1_BH11PLA1_14400 [soil metagenome]
MTFAHPWVLLLLLLPGALGVWEVVRRGRVMVMPVDHVGAPRRPVLNILLRAAAFVPPLLAGLVIVVLAGPQVLGPPREERQLTNIELVLDVSGSMTSPIPSSKPGATRYSAAMEAIESFAEARKGDAAGLTIFGNEVIRWLPLTKDLRAIKAATPFVNPAKVPPGLGGTAVAKAVRFAHHLIMEPATGDRLIILLTDGESGDLAGGAAGELGMQLARDGVVLHAINVGSPRAPAEMFELAQPTGGSVHNATDAGSLREVFNHIDKMKPAKISQGAPEPITHGYPFALAALLALGVHQLASFGVRWTPW